MIELLVVLAVVSTLLMLTVPRYYRQVDAAKETVLRDNLRVTRDVIGKFYADAGRYPVSLEELVERRYLMAVPVDPLTESTSSWKLVSPPSGYAGEVYDLRSGAPGQDEQGRAYATW